MAEATRNVIYKGEKESHDLSMPPSPQKKPRTERGPRKSDNCNKKGGRRCRQGCSDLALGSSDLINYEKSEFPDFVNKGDIQEKVTVYQTDASNKHITCNSSTPTSLHCDAGEYSHATEIRANKDLDGIRRSSVKREAVTTSPGILHDQPDSSTGAYDQISREDAQGQSVSFTDVATSACTTSYTQVENTLCQVCGDLAAGFYCRAYICEACKKFFIRASKLEQPKYVCLRSKHCAITKESRVHCQYCRYQKCLRLNMSYPKDGQMNISKIGVQEIPCRVCSAPSSGFHFGALTCEGCKGFFRRMVKEREAYSYKCSRNGSCEVNAMTRNMCKACRYNKCLKIGMSVEGSRIGRQPNAIKHALSMEARKQAAMKLDSGTDNEGNTDSNPSQISFDSVILDHFVPGEMDDSLHLIDLIQVSSSADVLKPPVRKAEKIKLEPEPSLPYCQVNHVLNETEQEASFAAPVDHSDIDRHDMPSSPTSLDHHKFNNHSYTSSLNSSISATVPRNFESKIFDRPRTEASDSSNDNQPQDLSIDLSKPRILTTNSDQTPPPIVLSASSHLSSFGRSSYSVPQSEHISLPLPSSDTPTTSYNYPVDYTHHQVQQNIQGQYSTHSFVGQDKYFRPSYRQLGRYESNSPSFTMDSQNSQHSIAHMSRHVTQQETITNRLFSQSGETQNSIGQFSSQFSDHDMSSHIIHERLQTSYFHHLGPEPLYNPELVSSRQNNMDEMHPHLTGHHNYNPQLNRGNVHRSSSDLCKFHNRSCQSPEQHNLVISQQLTSHSHTSTLSQPTVYVIPHSISYDMTSTSQGQSKENRLTPRSSQNDSIQNSSSSMPFSGKVTSAENKSYLKVPNEELHAILLDAARNLHHFCVVSRAKSDLFEAGRFHDVDSTWDKMMEHFNFHARCIVRFAKKVPGFRSLKIDDQVLLLRMATYSLVIFNHSRTYEPDTGFYNYFNFTNREIQMIREFFPEFDVIHAHYKHTGIMAQRDGLTEIEYAYLSCILLLNDEYSGLQNTERTKELKERFLDAFQDYEIEHFPNGSLRFCEMLKRLSEFSQFSMEHNIAVGLVITKNPQLHIPQLYAEMYNHENSAQGSTDSANDDEIPDVVGELIEPPTVGTNK